MNESAIKSIQNASEDELFAQLTDYNVKHAQIFQFPEFTAELKQLFFEALFQRLNEKLQRQTYVACLEAIRIVSREKSGLEAVSTESALRTLLHHAGLVTSPGEDEENLGFTTIQDAIVIIEAQKCLCNIIFNSHAAQRICSTNNCIEGIVQRLKTYKDPALVHEIKFFDMRMLFVLTALCREVRPKLRQDLHGLTYLIEVLDLTLRSADEAERPVSDQEVDLCCEVLKILFNITVSTDSNNMDEEEEAHFLRLVSVLHDLLLCHTATKEKRDELHRFSVNADMLVENLQEESLVAQITVYDSVQASGGLMCVDIDKPVLQLVRGAHRRYQETLACTQKAATEEDKKVAARRRATEEIKSMLEKKNKLRTSTAQDSQLSGCSDHIFFVQLFIAFVFSHTVNLLTNMPRESYEELLTPVNEDAAGAAERKDIEHDGRNMEAIVELLEFLENRLDVPQQSLKESLAPVLHCLCQICRANRSIRKFCRLKALPYLRDEVKYLPQEGSTLRNKLCRLFTNPIVEIKELAADFLFVLCKSNVSRFVKYTGYGNAAGLLAQRGLMCGGRGEEYSSESEDSETEEYSELKDNINPVTGRWELPKPSPMEGMSEEQKEYEAMQLVEKLDKLQRAGVIQPTKISEGGKPVPVEHVAELLEGISDPPNASGDESD